MYNWNWSVIWTPSSDGTTSFAMTLVHGLGWTLLVGLSAWILALAIGTAVGIARTLEAGTVARLADGYVEVLRSVPLIVQMFIWFYVAPDVLPERMALVLKEWDRYNVLAAILCLALFTSARVAEQVRAGIQAIPTGQLNAARALGMQPPQVYRYVLIPTAVRKILPALTNEFLNIIKNTSVAFTIAVVELMAATRTMQEMTFQIFEAFTVATLVYLLVNLIIVKAMGMIERRIEIPGHGRR
ncbi:glutamate and aspartate transporter subunit; membrane component of ABC superfamily [Burkholderiales bacterium 8X]|nr:glutamate and aspartate transporter subunit; membrane component of ABC superfamily [Burkholderiales bacterium 8X]